MPTLPVKIGLVATGGAIGAVLRYGLGAMSVRFLGESVPWATLGINLTGSFLIGVLWALSEHVTLHRFVVPFLFVGVLGSFTTFSTFALEGFTLVRGGQQIAGVSYMIASSMMGLLLVFAGYVAARSFLATPH